MYTGKKTVYIIAGPSAVGKSAVAFRLAQQLGTQIVSADSRQCYREMSIGTAKPNRQTLAAIKHYFTDCFSVTRHITAADFEHLALGYLETIFRDHDTAIVCGGTGLYIKALCDGLDALPAVDTDIDKQVNEDYRKYGTDWLAETLRQEDPAFAASGEMQNPARMIRALVFVRSAGMSITTRRTGLRKQRPFHILAFALNLPREQLYQRIDERVGLMMQEGLEEEARTLYPFRHLKNLQTVGYTELFDYFEGKHNLTTAVALIRQHTRNYAKRQLTWFRKDPRMQWLNAASPDIVQQILTEAG